MRVLQLIDSLQTGGAERMAINIANGLSSKIELSFLCATRKEGLLKNSISQKVNYLFLDKKKVIDVKAIKTLNKYVRTHNIDIIHAHSTSYFLATIIKILNPKLKLVWHDHYGRSEYLSERPKLILYFCSFFFNHVFSVNLKLERWAKNKLNVKSVSYLSNFVVEEQVLTSGKIQLKGKSNKRIICLANLREQKDHFTLLSAFKNICDSYPDWTLHLIGKDFKDKYSKAIYNQINKNRLEENIYVYGSCDNTFDILEQCDIGVLSSKSEGLPLALLEYGLKKLPVIVTDVGDCGLVIDDHSLGQLIPPQDINALRIAMINFIENPESAKQKGLYLNDKITREFTQTAAIKRIITVYKSI